MAGSFRKGWLPSPDAEQLGHMASSIQPSLGISSFSPNDELFISPCPAEGGWVGEELSIHLWVYGHIDSQSRGGGKEAMHTHTPRSSVQRLNNCFDVLLPSRAFCPHLAGNYGLLMSGGPSKLWLTALNRGGRNATCTQRNPSKHPIITRLSKRAPPPPPPAHTVANRHQEESGPSCL